MAEAPAAVVDSPAPDQQVADQVDQQIDATQAAEPAQPEPLDSGYVERASTFGLTEDDLRVVPRDTIERMIASADRAMIQSAYRDNGQQVQHPHVPQERRENGQFAPPSDFAFDPFELKFDQDVEADAPLTKNVAALHDHFSKQFQKLHQHYEQKFKDVFGFRDSMLRQQDYALLDRFVEQQGPDWSAVFGKGQTLEMNPQSQEFLNREEVRTAAIAMIERSARMGRKMTAAEALPRARNALFMEKAFAIERAKANGKRDALAAGAVDRSKPPTNAPAPMTIADRARLMREAAKRA